MKNRFVFFAAIVVLGACSSEPNVVHLRTEKGKKETKAPVIANRALNLEIEGMTCEMGCGGSIRKELKGTGGVARVEFIDFNDKNKVQKAKISFDTAKITADEIVKIVNTINDKQFTAHATGSELIDSPANTSTENSEEETEEETVKMSDTRVEIPNLLDIFSGFVL